MELTYDPSIWLLSLDVLINIYMSCFKEPHLINLFRSSAEF